MKAEIYEKRFLLIAHTKRVKKILNEIQETSGGKKREIERIEHDTGTDFEVILLVFKFNNDKL